MFIKKKSNVFSCQDATWTPTATTRKPRPISSRPWAAATTSATARLPAPSSHPRSSNRPSSCSSNASSSSKSSSSNRPWSTSNSSSAAKLTVPPPRASRVPGAPPATNSSSRNKQYAQPAAPQQQQPQVQYIPYPSRSSPAGPHRFRGKRRSSRDPASSMAPSGCFNKAWKEFVEKVVFRLKKLFDFFKKLLDFSKSEEFFSPLDFFIKFFWSIHVAVLFCFLSCILLRKKRLRRLKLRRQLGFTMRP